MYFMALPIILAEPCEAVPTAVTFNTSPSGSLSFARTSAKDMSFAVSSLVAKVSSFATGFSLTNRTES